MNKLRKKTTGSLDFIKGWGVGDNLAPISEINRRLADSVFELEVPEIADYSNVIFELDYNQPDVDYMPLISFSSKIKDIDKIVKFINVNNELLTIDLIQKGDLANSTNIIIGTNVSYFVVNALVANAMILRIEQDTIGLVLNSLKIYGTNSELYNGFFVKSSGSAGENVVVSNPLNNPVNTRLVNQNLPVVVSNIARVLIDNPLLRVQVTSGSVVRINDTVPVAIQGIPGVRIVKLLPFIISVNTINNVAPTGITPPPDAEFEYQYARFGDFPCDKITIFNDTGQDLRVRRFTPNNSSPQITIFNGRVQSLNCAGSSNEYEVRSKNDLVVTVECLAN